MDNTVVRFVLKWTEENIYTDAGIECLVKEVGYSRKTLEIWFRRNCGLSPGEYLMRRRMSRAAVLLRMTMLPVTEIAILFHFHSSQNFARAFKKFTGVTPSEYRNQEKWSIKSLQQPLLIEEFASTELKPCVFPELRLHGSLINCQDNFLTFSTEDSLTITMRESLNLHRENGDKEICIACRITPSTSLSDGRSSFIDVEMLIEHEDEDEETIIIPEGKYIEYHFCGSWNEYVVFTRVIYFNLSEKNICRRNNFDLTFFTFPADSNEEVTCRHYIPVE